jgi:hypothetical protein
MLTRIFDVLNLQLLKTREWLGDLSPIGTAMLGAALFGLLTLAAHWIDSAQSSISVGA